MTVDCRKYSIALNKSLNTIDFLWAKTDDKQQMVVEFSVTSGIPIVVVCFFVNRQYGHFEQVQKLSDSLISFYKYSKIIDFSGNETNYL
jgi:hypothetical protein